MQNKLKILAFGTLISINLDDSLVSTSVLKLSITNLQIVP